MDRPTIKKAIPTLMTDGAFFKNLPSYGTSTPLHLGLVYSLQHSGEKLCGDFVLSYLDDDGVITPEGIEMIGYVLNHVYKNNWDRKYEAYLAEYNPLENYSMTETSKETKSGKDTVDIAVGSQTVTNEYGAKVSTEDVGKVEHSDVLGATSTTENLGPVSENTSYGGVSQTDILGAKKETVTNDVNGFNSGLVNSNQNITDTDSITNSHSEEGRVDNFSKEAVSNTFSEDERTNTHTEEARTNTFTENSKTDTFTTGAREDTTTTTYGGVSDVTLERSGNIGVTTSQQMLLSELELRSYDFFENMFSDIDKYLCLKIF